MILLGAFLFSIAFLLVRTLSDDGVPVGLLVSLRGAFQGIVYMVMLICKRLPWLPPTRKGASMLTMRAVGGGAGFTLFFVAHSFAPLGEASAICSSYPVITMLVAHACLDERMGYVGLFSIAALCSGLVLLASRIAVSKPESSYAAFGIAPPNSTLLQVRADATDVDVHTILLGYGAAVVSPFMATS